MTENSAFLDDIQDELKQIVQPYQRDLNQKQKKADFIKLCIRCAGRDDFLRLDELLKGKVARDIAEDDDLDGCDAIFESLGNYADEKVEQYRIELIDDLTRLCEEADLPLDMDFPRFSVLKGITGEIDFSARCTRINKKVLKSIDPRRILTAVQRFKQQLYGGTYDPQKFIDSLCKTYLDCLKKEKLSLGTSLPIQKFYLDHVISLQNKTFFVNMDKGKFKGYSLDQFSVDLWRYFQAGIGGTSQGYDLQLTPGRNGALWLIDSAGELRRMTAISFHDLQE